MNAKGINLTDKTTGETSTGTMQEIADKVKVNRKTLSRWIEKGHYENDLWDISKANGTLEEENKPKGTFETKREIPNGTFEPPKVEDVTKGIKTDETGKVILPRKPCIKCGQPVYHTLRIDGKIQHICFGSCTPPIVKVIKPMNQATLEYVRAFNKANSPKEKEI